MMIFGRPDRRIPICAARRDGRLAARVFAVSCGLAMLCGSVAQANRASSILDARDDLFANSAAPALATSTAQQQTPQVQSQEPPAAMPQASPPPGLSSQDVQPARSGAALPAGNPLWFIRLDSLKATVERPLFAPTRRPAVVPPKPVAVAPPPRLAAPEKPPLSLVGTVAGTTAAKGFGIFVDQTTKATVQLRAGENHKGWILRAVKARRVEMAKGLDSAVLVLAAPDMKSTVPPTPGPGVAPPSAVPPPGGAPGAHSASPAAASSGMPRPIPVSGTISSSPAGAPAAPPSSNLQPGGEATIVVRPPSFAPPAVQPNPFQNKRLP